MRQVIIGALVMTGVGLVGAIVQNTVKPKSYTLAECRAAFVQGQIPGDCPEWDSLLTADEAKYGLKPWSHNDRFAKERNEAVIAAMEREWAVEKEQTDARLRKVDEELADLGHLIDVDLPDEMSLVSCVDRERGARHFRCQVKVTGGMSFQGWALSATAYRWDVDASGMPKDLVALPGGLVNAPEWLHRNAKVEIEILVPARTEYVRVDSRR